MPMIDYQIAVAVPFDLEATVGALQYGIVQFIYPDGFVLFAFLFNHFFNFRMGHELAIFVDNDCTTSLADFKCIKKFAYFLQRDIQTQHTENLIIRANNRYRNGDAVFLVGKKDVKIRPVHLSAFQGTDIPGPIPGIIRIVDGLFHIDLVAGRVSTNPGDLGRFLSTIDDFCVIGTVRFFLDH